MRERRPFAPSAALHDPAFYRSRSFWLDDLDDDPLVPRDPLDGDVEADVAIVGAGFTGLWTAHYLRQRDPGLRIVVLEAEIAGFGASGRNGGWASALLPMSLDAIARGAGGDRQAATDLQRRDASFGRRTGPCGRRARDRVRPRQGRLPPRGDQPGPPAPPARGARLVARVGLRRRAPPAADPRGDVGGGRHPARAGRPLHAALRRDPAGQARPWPRRRARTQGRHDLRTLARVGDRAPDGHCGGRACAGPLRRTGDRGVHAEPRRRTAHAGPAVLADDRHRTVARCVLGAGRAPPAGDVQRRTTAADLRAAHRRRPVRLRWPRRAVPLRLATGRRLRPP